MRIISFHARGIHGYLNFDLNFHSDLSFLTGINGSGKTTSLNCIIALFSGDLATLASLEYDYISLFVHHQDKQMQIYSYTIDDNIALCIQGMDKEFKFPIYLPVNDQVNYKQYESEQEYYRELAVVNAGHQVLRTLSALPKPMFLGIDRRSNLGLSTFEHPRLRAQRFGKNIFGHNLANSVVAAADLASQKYRDAVIQSSKLTERLQREVLLGFLGEEASSKATNYAFKLPTEKELKELHTIRRDVDSIATMMQLPTKEVRKLLIPLLDVLTELSAKIPTNTNIDDVLHGKDVNPDVINAILGWSASQPRLERIRFISKKVAGYHNLRQEIMAPSQRYEERINSFLADSGKKIALIDDGTMEVRINGVKEAKTVASLSSGEAQLFVILTHLAFNPTAQKDNIFIIDEPELSLHLQWQEMFVDSIMAANPNIQYILATHSPSIILDRTNKCIESKKVDRVQ